MHAVCDYFFYSAFAVCDNGSSAGKRFCRRHAEILNARLNKRACGSVQFSQIFSGDISNKCRVAPCERLQPRFIASCSGDNKRDSEFFRDLDGVVKSLFFRKPANTKKKSGEFTPSERSESRGEEVRINRRIYYGRILAIVCFDFRLRIQRVCYVCIGTLGCRKVHHAQVMKKQPQKWPR